ncbi:MAG: tetratricopeptide repeat protein [Deltaproteobacteria bacterium]|nr:tetratricopeptide repeat protein [Deltaproteobacteria bacterium]
MKTTTHREMTGHRIMTRLRNTALGAFLVGSVALVAAGCGTPKTTTNPKDVKAADGMGAAGDGSDVTKGVIGEVKVAPKRKIAADAKVQFKKLVVRYRKATAGGKKLAQAACEDLASEFGSLYGDAPKLTEAKFNEGALYLQCSQTAKAEKSFRELLQKHPQNGRALNNLGMIAYRRDQMTTAADYFQKAARAKASGGYANLAMLGRGKALNHDTAALQSAIDNIHRALAVDSSNIAAYEMLATIIYDHAKSKSQLEIARLIVVQALKLDPHHAPLYNLLGLVLLKMNEVTRALKQFRKAVSIDSSLIAAHMNIGAITLSFRDYKAAERAFTRVIASSTTSKKMKIDAIVGRGVALRGQRKFKAAMAAYEKAQKMDPQNDGIAYNTGILVQDHFFDASNPDAAIATLQRAMGYLQRYASSARYRTRRKDARRRIKNIKQMIPMLREQKKMQAEMQKMQAAEKAAPAPKTPAAAPAK